MSSFLKTDLALVAPMPTSEVIRHTLEKAKLVLESPTSSKYDRDFMIRHAQEIYESGPATRTLYHHLCACYLLSVHSTEGLVKRKAYATKCLTEAKKKLKKIELAMDSADNEYSVSEQLFKGLQKVAVAALDKIGEEVRQARAEGKILDMSPKKVDVEETRHARKKKRVSWGGIEEYSDDGEENSGWGHRGDSDGEDIGDEGGEDEDDDGDEREDSGFEDGVFGPGFEPMSLDTSGPGFPEDDEDEYNDDE